MGFYGSARTFPQIQEKIVPEGLSVEIGNQMIENCIGCIGLPLGLGMNFIINGETFCVPMAIEEPSVIAAASSGAKTVAESGGFNASTSDTLITAQLLLADIPNERLQDALDAIELQQTVLINLGNEHCVRMKNRGGGVQKVFGRILKKQDKSFLVVHVVINVCDGAFIE